MSSAPSYPPASACRTTAIILAGGTGQRLGGILKANIRVGGVTLLERLTRQLSPQCTQVHVTTGTHGPELFATEEGTVRIADPGRGPAAGFVAALEYLRRADEQPEFVVTAAVDTPFFPADFLQRAMERIACQDAVIGAYKGRNYPTNSLWRFSSLKSLVHTVANPDRGPSFFSFLDHLRWETLDYDAWETENPFLNVNTMTDLLACNRRAIGQAGMDKPCAPAGRYDPLGNGPHFES